MPITAGTGFALYFCMAWQHRSFIIALLIQGFLISCNGRPSGYIYNFDSQQNQKTESFNQSIDESEPTDKSTSQQDNEQQDLTPTTNESDEIDFVDDQTNILPTEEILNSDPNDQDLTTEIIDNDNKEEPETNPEPSTQNDEETQQEDSPIEDTPLDDDPNPIVVCDPIPFNETISVSRKLTIYHHPVLRFVTEKRDLYFESHQTSADPLDQLSLDKGVTKNPEQFSQVVLKGQKLALTFTIEANSDVEISDYTLDVLNSLTCDNTQNETLNASLRIVGSVDYPLFKTVGQTAKVPRHLIFDNRDPVVGSWNNGVYTPPTLSNQFHLSLNQNQVQTIYLLIDIPKSLNAGEYKTSFNLKSANGSNLVSLPMKLTVLETKFAQGDDKTLGIYYHRNSSGNTSLDPVNSDFKSLNDHGINALKLGHNFGIDKMRPILDAMLGHHFPGHLIYGNLGINPSQMEAILANLNDPKYSSLVSNGVTVYGNDEANDLYGAYYHAQMIRDYDIAANNLGIKQPNIASSIIPTGYSSMIDSTCACRAGAPVCDSNANADTRQCCPSETQSQYQQALDRFNQNQNTDFNWFGAAYNCPYDPMITGTIALREYNFEKSQTENSLIFTDQNTGDIVSTYKYIDPNETRPDGSKLSDQMISYPLYSVTVLTACEDHSRALIQNNPSKIVNYSNRGSYDMDRLLKEKRRTNGEARMPHTIKEFFYFQSWTGTPVLYRYLTGVFLKNSYLDGFYPFIYNFGLNVNRFADPWLLSDGSEPDMMMVLPSSIGPIDTMGYEALREGITDYRVIKTAELLFEKTKNEFCNSPETSRNTNCLELDHRWSEIQTALFSESMTEMKYVDPLQKGILHETYLKRNLPQLAAREELCYTHTDNLGTHGVTTDKELSDFRDQLLQFIQYVETTF